MSSKTKNKNKNKIKASIPSISFDIINHLFMIFFCMACLYPFLFLISMSLSAGSSNFASLKLIPEVIDFSAYRRVLSNEFMVSGFVNTFIRVGIAVPLVVMAIVFTAYPLSKKYFPHRGFWTGFIVFTMFFSGGLIPSYLVIRGLGLLDSVWALILPGLIPAYNMIIVRNYFMSISPDLEESARIDGANDFTILMRIILPISAPIIATVSLWTAVGHWNAWFDSMIYMQKASKQVLQVVLRRIVLEGTQDMMDLNTGMDEMASVSPDNIKAATIMVATIPILMVYPFIQKYFVKGIMVGSLKG
ncbi:MAG: carbohydrate ABC transporter permease [Epulopiscium sp.]|nr:carbohydrate ABC transporter permease [Candidatus Epulonipiscium sp.]